MIDIRDNFLKPEAYQQMKDFFFAEKFPWYFMNAVVNHQELDDPTLHQFTHMLYDTQSQHVDEFFPMVYPILGGLNVIVPLRCKLNCRGGTKEHIETAFHVDLTGEPWEKVTGTGICNTSIFYFNTNNGYTEFENGEIVETVENRLVTFPSTMYHRGVSTTDDNRRVVLNLNWI